MDLTFFGLTSEVAKQFRVNLFTQIHEIVFYGQGGYNWETVYNMPIWLRKFTFHTMKKHYDEKSGDENNGLDAQTKAITSGQIQIPEQFRGKLEQKTPKY